MCMTSRTKAKTEQSQVHDPAELAAILVVTLLSAFIEFFVRCRRSTKDQKKL